MIVVADSSPLVILAKLGCFNLLNRLFPRLYISTEVHYEVVVAGVGQPGASEVASAAWVEVKKLQNQNELAAAQQKYPLGAGELSTILLGKNCKLTHCCSMTTRPVHSLGLKVFESGAAWAFSKRSICAAI